MKRRGPAVAQVVGGLQKMALNISLVLWGIFVFVPTLIIACYEIGGAHLLG